MFTRKLETKIKQLAKSFPALLLTGPRQSGKTTLLKHLFPDFKYVFLEAPDILLEVKNDPRGFLAQNVKGWIFDEAQNLPELFSFLQEYLDSPDRAPVILTGSQNFLLQEKISQSLAGRIGILELLPLSVSELQTQDQFKKLPLFDILYQGLYPRPYHENIPTTDWYQSYIRTYLERDVRQMSQIGDLSQFQLFLKLCAGRVGQLLNLESLATDCGITQPTAKRWLSILESGRVIFLLQPHFQNFRKRLVKRPKLFFYDSSIVCGLLGIQSSEQLYSHALRGSIFESFILSEVMKYFSHKGVTPPLYFWRDHAGSEVDGLIDYGGRLLALEVKSSQTLVQSFTHSLLRWHKISQAPLSDLGLIYAGSSTKKLNQLSVTPWDQVESLLEGFGM